MTEKTLSSATARTMSADHASGDNAARSGIGRATNKRRQGRAIILAHRFARLMARCRSRSVFAYIWRYSFEITNASRTRSVCAHFERSQIAPML